MNEAISLLAPKNRSRDYWLIAELGVINFVLFAVLTIFISKGFEPLAGGKRSATTGGLVQVAVSGGLPVSVPSCIPLVGCVGVAGVSGGVAVLTTG